MTIISQYTSISFHINRAEKEEKSFY